MATQRISRDESRPTAELFVDATIELIAEKGGSAGVNLREISRSVGCAHTNAYNYFDSLQDLFWQAMYQVLIEYGHALSAGLSDSVSPRAYFRRLFSNMVDWSVDNPGLYRFISCDQLDPDEIPDDIVALVTQMKSWLGEVLSLLAGDRLGRQDLERLVHITLGYVDGEVLNLVTGRVLPGEDPAGRVIDNLERLFTLLTASTHDGQTLPRRTRRSDSIHYPTLDLSRELGTIPPS